MFSLLHFSVSSLKLYKKLYVLIKTIEGYQNSFDVVTFYKIISKKGIFVLDRTTNL